VVSGKSDNNSGFLYNTDMHLTVHTKLRILERGHICSVDGSRTRKENVKRRKICGSGQTEKLKDKWIDTVIRDGGKMQWTAKYKRY